MPLTNRRLDALRALEPFRLFSALDLGAFGAIARERWLEPGDALFRPGDRGGTLSIVAQGQLTVLLPELPGRAAEVADLGPGAIVGEGAFIDAAPRSAAIVASTPTLVVELEQGGFEALLRHHPNAGSRLMGVILRDVARRLHAVDRRIAIELGEVSGFAPLSGPPEAPEDAKGRPAAAAARGATTVTPRELRACGVALWCRDDELEALLTLSVERRFAAGEVLSHQGTEARSCFVIVSGEVEVVKVLMHSERALTTLGPGAIAGQAALVDRSRRSSTLRAATPVVALELARDAFDLLLQSSSAVAVGLQRHLAATSVRQLRAADERLAAVLARSAPVERTRRDLEYLRAAVGEVDMNLDVIEMTDDDLVPIEPEPVTPLASP